MRSWPCLISSFRFCPFHHRSTLCLSSIYLGSARSEYYSWTSCKRPPRISSQVVAYGRWSPTRAWAILGQNFSWLECGNRRYFTHAHDDAMFYSCTSHFRAKTTVLPIEKFPFLELARDTTMLQHLIVHFSRHYLSSGRLREVKSKRKFQNFSSKSGRGRLQEVVGFCPRSQEPL